MHIINDPVSLFVCLFVYSRINTLFTINLRQRDIASSIKKAMCRYLKKTCFNKIERYKPCLISCGFSYNGISHSHSVSLNFRMGDFGTLSGSRLYKDSFLCSRSFEHAQIIDYNRLTWYVCCHLASQKFPIDVISHSQRRSISKHSP